MNIMACVPIHRKDDNRNAQFKTAQQLLNKEKMTTESKLSSSKAKQTVLDLTSPANRTVFGDISSKQDCLQRTKNVGSKAPAFPIAIFIYKRRLLFDVADSQSFAVLVDLCIEFCQQYDGYKYKALNEWSWWSASRCST